jgi:hypothetical protein
MTATIPAGRAARTAWRRLDRQTKAEVLRRAAEGGEATANGDV